MLANLKNSSLSSTVSFSSFEKTNYFFFFSFFVVVVEIVCNNLSKFQKPTNYFTAKRSPNAKDGRTPEEIRKLIDR